MSDTFPLESPAYALCPDCLQLSVWYTTDGELPRHEPLHCHWCKKELDREKHKARRPEGLNWAQ